MPEPDTTVPEPKLETSPSVDTTTTPPQDNGGSNTDVEALKAQLQKIEMERNLLRKKVDSNAKQQDEQTKKELEEKEDYRALAERATTQLEELLKEKKDTETKQTIETATADVLKDYDPKVAELAKKTGLTATDDSDDAKAAFKAKLDDISSTIGITSTTPPVQGNNPAPKVEAPSETPKYQPVFKELGLDVVGQRQATARNSIIARTHLKNLDSIKAMKTIAGVEAQDL
jgi:hypothetical protein